MTVGSALALGAVTIGWALSRGDEETREEGVHAAIEAFPPVVPDEVIPVETGAGFSLETRPSGARVFLNGKLLDDRTPITIRDLEPGNHVLHVEYGPRYAPWQTQIEVRPGEHLKLPRAVLVLKSALVEFRSDPPGAEVVLSRGRDTRVLGTTPTQGEIDVSAAAWTVTMRKAGYASWSAAVIVPSGAEEHSIHAHLERRGAELPSIAAPPPPGKPAPETQPAPSEATGSIDSSDPLDNPYR